MEAVFLRVLNMSLSAALVIVVVMLVRLPLRRAPRKWSYLLWAVVAFRLVCPVSFSAPFSVLRLTAQQAVTQSAAGSGEIAYVPQDIGYMAQPRVYFGTPGVGEAISAALPDARPADSANPLQVWSFIAAVLWCAGIAALLLYGMISYVNLKCRLRGAVRTESGVFETDAVRAPFILGLLSPKIYLPPGLEGETRRYVLAHERFHIRRCDHAVKLLAFLLLCVHWFDPLVWLAYCLMSRDMEMRCDEAVVSGESGVTKPYSMALLSFATARRFPSPSPLCFGETDVKERIKNVLRWKKPKAWATVLAALLCVIAVAACAANPKKGETTGGRPSPWDWTSTVALSDIKGFAEGRGITLSHTQMKQLVALLNAVRPDEVVRGRGIPSSDTLDITTGVGYRLRWGGGIIELDFDDAAAAAELYGSPETLGPGVWEIHNDALYAFLDGLKNQQSAPASATDLRPTQPQPTPDPLHSYEAVSGGQSVQLLPLLTAEEGQEYTWLTITYEGSGEPFYIRRDGETITCGYEIWDAETQEPLDFFHPSGVSPQTYLFQNAVPGRKYIVVVDTFTDDPEYGRTYAFGAIAPERGGVGLQKHVPSVLGTDGTELYLNMNLQDLNAALDTQLSVGPIYLLPQHSLGVAAILIKDPAWMYPVVQLGFGEGWTPSEGPGVGATTEEVRAYWGEPYIAAEPVNERTPTLNYLLYALEDGYLEFDHRGDGIIYQINLYGKSYVEGEAGTLGTRTYYHGRSSAHIENFNCFGEVFLMCVSARDHGPYRMIVTDADGTESVLAEGTGSYQTVVPAPQIQNGTLDVEVSENWILEINWFPTEENRIQRETVIYP